MKTHYHPAPGIHGALGELMTGFFVVPQNPIDNRNTVKYIPSMGEILQMRMTVPRNALISQIRGNGLSGCCCDGGSNSTGNDVGFLNGQPLFVGLGDAFSNVNWLTVALIGGLVLLARR